MMLMWRLVVGMGGLLMTRRRWGFEQVALDDHVSVGRDTDK